ncbi:MAG: hypothetical protein D6814_04370 [Calditrichaeota bacterium]|nr:MAG: hypothetical protein D6814_04370 [Calditrichota bacterium]
MILAVRFPLRQALQGTFLLLGQRQAQTISKVSIAVSALFHEGRFDYLRIALGAVAPTVVYASQTESILKNGKLDAQKIEAAKRAIVHEVQPISDIRSTAEYRRAMCPVLLDKALEELGMK